MTKLLKPKEGVKYTDLIIGFESENSSENNVDEYGDEDDDLAAPPVRYFYASWYHQFDISTPRDPTRPLFLRLVSSPVQYFYDFYEYICPIFLRGR